MFNNFTSPYRLPPITALISQRESQINFLINSLKIGDIKADSDFSRTTTRIKSSILLTPVEFDEPKYVDHKFVERTLSPQQQLIGGISSNQYIHEIEVSFTGDTELFDYVPDGYSYGSKDHGLISPNGNRLMVRVPLSVLNPNKAIQEANEFLDMTMRFVRGNNEIIEGWSAGASRRIDDLLIQKRAELIRIFG